MKTTAVNYTAVSTLLRDRGKSQLLIL